MSMTDPQHRTSELESPSIEPEAVYVDNSVVECRFNVMPERFVSERLTIHEYRVWSRFIEARFDREYQSEMLSSPSHLVFLTLLCHTQKLLYVWLCHTTEHHYDPEGPELFKLWPTKINIRIPELIREEHDLIQKIEILEWRQQEQTGGKIWVRSTCGSSYIDGCCPYYFADATRVR